MNNTMFYSEATCTNHINKATTNKTKISNENNFKINERITELPHSRRRSVSDRSIILAVISQCLVIVYLFNQRVEDRL